MVKHYYCSVFSNGYAYKGLLLYKSLLRWDKNFHFFFVCLDNKTKNLLEKMSLVNATILTMAQIEKADHELLQVKQSRNEKEYAWTSKASVMLYILNNYQTDHIVWLDGDTFFYADPTPIFKEWGNYSIMLTEERWRKANRDRIYTKGRYNTGFMGFKKDNNATQCLQWFRSRLLEWCYDRLENGLWSDQLYVNDWLRRFNNVGVIKNIGVNIGPYIIQGCNVTKSRSGSIYVNDTKLIFYHSYGFRYYDGNEFDLCSYIMAFSDDVIRWIYLPYIQACNEVVAEIRKIDSDFYPPVRPKSEFIRNYYNVQANSKKTHHICTVLTKDYLVQGLTLYSSLKRNNPNFHLWILCVDTISYKLLFKMGLEKVTLISLENIRNEKLAEKEKEREIHEYCWTLKASFMTYLIKNNLNFDSILYLDSDLFFFDSISSIYNEWGSKSAYLTRLWLGPKWAKRVGTFSAGLVGVKRNGPGMKCLTHWRKSSLKWCYDRFEEQRWADQVYLNHWPRMAGGELVVSANKGINSGPWNVRKGYISSSNVNEIFYDHTKLICYHFSGFRILSSKKYELCNRKVLPEKADPIYSAYVKAVKKSITEIEAVNPSFIDSISIAKDKSEL